MPDRGVSKQDDLRLERLGKPRQRSDTGRYLYAFERLLSWLHREGYTDDDIAQRIDLPRVRKKKLEVLTEEERTRLFQTTRYLHLLHSDMQEKTRTFSPMDRLQRRVVAGAR